MFRQIPTGNKICATKDILANQQNLNYRIKNAKSQLKIKSPYRFEKTRRSEEQKKQYNQRIMKDNSKLMDKIINIQNRQSQKQAPFQLTKPINEQNRKKELINQIIGNQQILKRINEQKPSYNHKDLQAQRILNEQYVANISEFPFKKYSPHKTLTQVLISLTIYRTSSGVWIVLKQLMITRHLRAVSKQIFYFIFQFQKEVSKESQNLQNTRSKEV